MSFNLNELEQIAGLLNITLPSKADVKSATSNIKAFLGMRLDHVEDAMKWLKERGYSYDSMSIADMDKTVSKVLDFIEENYAKYDDYTMYELLDMFDDDIDDMLQMPSQ